MIERDHDRALLGLRVADPLGVHALRVHLGNLRDGL